MSKIDDAARKGMLDGLLHDDDLPKPKPSYTAPVYNQAPYEQDDLFPRRSTTYTPPRHNTSVSATPSVALSNVMAGAINDTRRRLTLITPEQRRLIVDQYMRHIGNLQDAAGLCWTSDGAQYLRAALEDLVSAGLYRGSLPVVCTDSFDENTGEVFNDA